MMVQTMYKDPTPFTYPQFKNKGLTIKTTFTGMESGAIWIGKSKNFGALDCGSADPNPKYPKGVPWDQKIFVKNFLIS